MKNSIRISAILGLSVFASYLFYFEGVGVNCFAFTFLSSAFLAYKSDAGMKRLSLAIAPAFFTSLLLIIYPQDITWFIWSISYLSMWVAGEIKLATLLIPLQGIISVFESPVEAVKAISIKPKFGSKFTVFGVVGLLAIVFIAIYSGANPIFGKLIDAIDLSFIDSRFVSVTILFFMLLFGLVRLRLNDNVLKMNNRPHILRFLEVRDRDLKEYNIAKAALWTLSGILAVVNVLDVIFIISGNLPEGMTYADFVHQGFYLLIISITIAGGIIIYFFRGSINFLKGSNQLRIASYVWIGLNIMLIVITAYKNGLYVECYGLTYKRIAVFLCLLCTFIGLVLSMRKVMYPTTNWNYFNLLAKYAFVAAVITTIVPYDYVITDYNLNYTENADVDYILSLKHPDLLEVQKKVAGSNESYFKNRRKYDLEKYVGYLIQQEQLHAKHVSWKSWSLYLEQYKRND